MVVSANSTRPVMVAMWKEPLCQKEAGCHQLLVSSPYSQNKFFVLVCSIFGNERSALSKEMIGRVNIFPTISTCRIITYDL